MFHQLTYEVTFPTGRTLKNSLAFDRGFYAITGSNETGKSFTLEMLRFLLFGSAALRGVAEDYKTLKASGSFTIKGVRYDVTRTMRKAELKRGEEIVATGVSVVNEKIAQTLGFGLHVFDTACSINQGEVERLGSMTSAERKRLVDSVLGIDALDVVARWGLDEARMMMTQAEAVRRTLTAPVEPAKPSPYIPGIDIAKVRGEAREAAEIDGWLSHVRAEPVKPICSVDGGIVAKAEAKAAMRCDLAGLQARVDALPSSTPYSQAQLDEVDWESYDRWVQADAWLKANPYPSHPYLRLRIFQDDHTALENFLLRGGLQARIRDLLAKGTKPCPHCGEDIPVEDEAIKRLEAERDALVLAPEPPPTPPLNRIEIERELRYVSQFNEQTWREMKAVKQVDRPTIARERISSLRQAIRQVAERDALLPTWTDAQATFDALPDYEGQLLEWRAYENGLHRYTAEQESFELWLIERDEKLARRNQIVLDPDAEANHLAARDYDRAYEHWKAAVEVYDAKVAEADRLEVNANNHRKVRELMNVLRSLIKQHLMPSLNKVASHLLSGMTGGQRNLIYVDDEFNVSVDSQRLETLSGSGKACANLALRIALGQVLTNRVISVLLADEIDASMDDFRAEQTSNVLGMLEKSISQVLLVSHKSVEATNHIRLGDFVGQSTDTV